MTQGKLARGLAAVAWALAAGPALAAEKCYDFSKMTVGTSYEIGDEVDISIGKVKIRGFLKDGEVVEPTSGIHQHLEITQSQISQEKPPEVALTLVGLQMVPREPVQEVSMLVAQQLGVNSSLPAWIEINGERHDFEGSFAQANNKVLGNATQGHARFKAQLVQDAPGPNGPSYWHRGRLGARAVDGAIETITIGAQAAHLDQICFRR
jgi:hypothetical protein